MLNYRSIFAILLVFMLASCSTVSYKHESLNRFGIEQRAVTKEQGAIKVRASVPGKSEAEQLFGIPVYNRGIQPVWLEITNNAAGRARLIMISVDKDYYSPLEVAYMHKKYFSTQGWMDMEEYLHETAMPRIIEAGETVSGFMYTNASMGTKSFNVDVYYTDNEPEYEQFTFFIEVPGFIPDHAEVDFKGLYEASEKRDLDLDGLRSALLEMPCCSTNRDGGGQGQPLNIVLVAIGEEILQAMLRAGWSETSYERDDNYLNNVNYLYGRPPDAVFRKSRGKVKSTERNELSLWLTPLHIDGKEVWIAKIKHAIGRRYEINEIFFGSAQDPDVDDGRNFLMQNLWYSQALEAIAYTKIGMVVPMDDPAVDFNDNPFFTDGVRIVMWLSGDPVALQDTRNMNWDVLLEK